jgi:hypothetical protein
VGGGTTTITATSTANSTFKAAVTVTVRVPLTGISLNKTTLKLVETEEETLTVSYIPSDTTDEKGVTWASSNPTVASVDSSSGVVTAVAAGTATITATSTVNAAIDDTCAVTVTLPVNGIDIIDVSFTGFEDETIDLGIIPDETNRLRITAPPGYVRYLWYVVSNGMSGQSTTTENVWGQQIYSPGQYYITVIVEKHDGSHFSKTVKYTVGY